MMSRSRTKHRGLSLMMVMAFVAVASVMGMAVLSSQTLQALGASGQTQALQADALAESGLNLGLYYLQNISNAQKCPLVLVLGGKTYSATRVSLGSVVSGNFDLAIVRTGQTTYTVRSTGRAVDSKGRSITRTLTSDARLNFFGFGVSLSMGSSSTATIPAKMTVNGDVYCAASVINNGAITGTLFTDNVTGAGTAARVLSLQHAPAFTPVPDPGAVNHYLSYVYNNRLYVASLLPSNVLANANLGPTDTNPAGIYMCSGSLKLAGNVKINGTLVVAGGLKIDGGNNSVTPVAGFPAMIVDSDLQFAATGKDLVTNGLTYVGGKVDSTGNTQNCSLTVTGALLCASEANSFDNVTTITVNYDSNLASIPTLIQGGTMPQPTSVEITGWR